MNALSLFKRLTSKMRIVSQVLIPGAVGVMTGYFLLYLVVRNTARNILTERMVTWLPGARIVWIAVVITFIAVAACIAVARRLRGRWVNRR